MPMIIDAHAHITDHLHGLTRRGETQSLSYGKVRLGDEESRLTPPLGPHTSFPPELLLEYMDWIGIEKTVLMQGSTYGDSNEYLWKAVKRWPDRFTAAAFMDPCSKNAKEVFRQATEEYGFQVLKFEMSEIAGFTGVYPDLRLDSEEMLWVWEETSQLDMVVTLDLGSIGSLSYQTQAVKNIIDQFPQLRIVIAHLAQPPFGTAKNSDTETVWQEQVMLAQHANLWMDMSALPALTAYPTYTAQAALEDTEDYPYSTAISYIRRAIELVGADKIMWGTDAPGVLQHATYAQLLSFVTRHCDFLSPEQINQIISKTAESVYWK